MRLINTHDQLSAAAKAGFDKQQLVAIAYSKEDKWHPAHWIVWSPFFKTDPEAAWYDHGCKTFSLFFHHGTGWEKRATALSVAKEWCQKKYGITEWAVNRFGDYVPLRVQAEFPIPKREGK